MKQQVFGFDTVILRCITTKNCFTVIYAYGCIIAKTNLRYLLYLIVFSRIVCY